MRTYAQANYQAHRPSRIVAANQRTVVRAQTRVEVAAVLSEVTVHRVRPGRVTGQRPDRRAGRRCGHRRAAAEPAHPARLRAGSHPVPGRLGGWVSGVERIGAVPRLPGQEVRRAEPAVDRCPCPRRGRRGPDGVPGIGSRDLPGHGTAAPAASVLTEPSGGTTRRPQGPPAERDFGAPCAWQCAGPGWARIPSPTDGRRDQSRGTTLAPIRTFRGQGLVALNNQWLAFTSNPL